MATPTLRSTVESVRSRCRRDTGSLSAKCPSRALANPKIALGVFEVDRVHFVRHGRRAHFARFEPLLEIPERNVAPHVARKIQQHGVGAHQRMTVLGNPVVRFDLGGVGVRREAQ